MLNLILPILLSLTLGGPALAHGVSAGDIEIIHPNLPLPPKTAQSAAGYMVIANDGKTPDRLLAVESPIAHHTSLHWTEFSADGVARMKPLDGIDVPAGENIALEPGGMHVMFMGLTETLSEGQMVPATLVFEHAGRIEIEIMVDPSEGVDHSKMDHAQMDKGASEGAHGGSHAMMSVAGGTDAEQIEALLKAQFDRPEAPLSVAPITIQGTVAVAGWSQDGNGGRAFLRKDAHGWFVELCSGESLILPATFQAMGLGRAEAELLAAAVTGAETNAGSDLVARLNSFQGTVVIGREGMAQHGHGDAPKH